MPENKVKKYYELIECWAHCSICGDMVALKIDKKEIINGLETGIYTKEYKHQNPNPDFDDTDDRSGEEHTIYVYIDEKYDVTGVKAFFGDTLSLDEIAQQDIAEGQEVRIPIIVKEIPTMSVQLGMISQEEFKVLKICDGMNTLEQVAEIAGKDVAEIEKMMDKLHKKGLVDVIRRG